VALGVAARPVACPCSRVGHIAGIVNPPSRSRHGYHAGACGQRSRGVARGSDCARRLVVAGLAAVVARHAGGW
jgi:hypothetical protein